MCDVDLDSWRFCRVAPDRNAKRQIAPQDVIE
jgi:hypothetical protein